MWGGKVVTGWHFGDPQPWPKIEALFGTHEAKFKIKKFVDTSGIARIERFTQAIGDTPFSEIEFAIPGGTVDAQVDKLSAAFNDFTGGPLSQALIDRFRSAPGPDFGLVLRIRGGQIVRVGALAPGFSLNSCIDICGDAKVGVDGKLPKLVGALGDGITRVEYGRAGDKAGVDIYLEPGEPAAKTQAAPNTDAN